MKNKIAIVGAGPAGIFCAYKILEKTSNADITIFDKNKPLLTILPTGNGRCNLAYSEYDYRELASNYPRGEKFLYSIFSKYGTEETLTDFEKIGVNTYVQDDFRIFPKENKSSYVRNKLLETIKYNVNFAIKEVKEPLKDFDCTVLATGLKQTPELAEKYGHRIMPIKPALCGLKIKEKEFLNLEGVSLNGVIFTKYGVSGPFIYKLSSINAYKNFPYEIKIPLLDKEQLQEEVLKNPKKLFKTIVGNFIPKALANVLIKNETQCANTSKKEIENIEYLKLTAIDTDGQGEIVHAGGVCLNEIDKNLKSKLVKNLWIIGELLDVDGFTGGFNLQNCWSTAAIAAENIVHELNLAP